MADYRLNTRLPQPLAQHVEKMIGEEGSYETSSEYVRDLIRHDMTKEHYRQYVQTAILEGYEDLAAGRFFESTGDFFKDREIVARKEAEGWK
jgi:antitoxin ParD1/3/4